MPDGVPAFCLPRLVIVIWMIAARKSGLTTQETLATFDHSAMGQRCYSFRTFQAHSHTSGYTHSVDYHMYLLGQKKYDFPLSNNNQVAH